MSNLLIDVVERMKAVSVDELSEKEKELKKIELEKSDRVVGVLSDDLRRLYVVMMAVAKKKDDFYKRVGARTIEVGGDLDEILNKEAMSLVRERDLVHNEYEMVHTCFWNSVRHAFPEIVGAGSIGLRKDWQVVVIRPKLEACRLIVIASSFPPYFN